MKFSTNLELVNKRQFARILALVIMIEGATMIPAGISAILFEETIMAAAFFMIAAILVGFGFVVRKFVEPSETPIRIRDGYLFLITSMLTAILIGAVPFIVSQNGYSIVDSIFESTAGWSTTGAYVLPRGTMPNSLILWKSEMNYMGGFVMIFLTVSVFQKLGIGGQKSVAHDLPGANFEKLTVKMSESAKILLKLYLILTAFELVLLISLGMHPYYALVNSLSTMSTSGMIQMDAGLPGFIMTPAIKLVLIVFTLLASFNFVFYFIIYERRWKLIFKNYEINLYLIIIAISTALISASLFIHKQYDGFAIIYNSLFQTISYSSTSGFTLSDISSWPNFSKTVLAMLPLIGGCGFSTSSGLKVHRVVILFKIAMRGVYKRIHPRSLKPVIMFGKPIPADRASSITVLGLLYFAVLIVSALVFSIDNFDIETSFSAAAAALTNNGTYLGLMTDGDFSIFSEGIKLFASLVMIAGKLELFTVFVLFSGSFWDTNRVTGQ